MKIKSIIIFLILIFSSGGILAERSLALQQQGGDSEFRLRFNTQHFVPFSYQTDGVVQGPVAEVIQLVCDEAQINCTMSLLNWDVAQKEVKNGRADGLFVLGWNASRAKWLNFTDPIIKTEYGFFARKNMPLNQNSVSDLQDHTIAVYGPSNTSKSLERIKMQLDGRLKIILYPQTDLLFQRLSLDRIVHAVYSNKDVGNTYIERLGLKNLRYFGRHRELNYYIGISKKVDVKLFERFNQAFAKLQRQGPVGKVMAKYGLNTNFAQKLVCSKSLRSDARILSGADIKSMRNSKEAPIYNAKQLKLLPCSYEHRFQPRGSGVLMDNALNVLWSSGNSIMKMSWNTALEYMAELNQKEYGGYRGWRLPTSEELNSVMQYNSIADNGFAGSLDKTILLPFWSVDKEAGSKKIWTADLVEKAFAPVNRQEILSVIAVRSIN